MDTPYKLLQNPDGAFARLAMSNGVRQFKELQVGIFTVLIYMCMCVYVYSSLYIISGCVYFQGLIMGR